MEMNKKLQFHMEFYGIYKAMNYFIFAVLKLVLQALGISDARFTDRFRTAEIHYLH